MGMPVNQLIESLGRKERLGIKAHAETVEMRIGDVLCEPGQQYHHIVFPLDGFISLVAISNNRQSLEVGMIGNEGMLGATMTLGIGSAPLLGVVQGAGSALQITIRQFQGVLSQFPGLHRALYRYQYGEILRFIQSTICSRFHDVESRLIRTLLMAQDRMGSNHLYLTHQVLANMLGVRRSSISIAAHTLQLKGLIRYIRGDITILSRQELEIGACACYGASTDMHTRLDSFR